MNAPANLPIGTIDRVGADFHFGLGMDTAEIAGLRMQTEAQVLRELSLQRSTRLGLPNPYRPERAPKPPRKVSEPHRRARERRDNIVAALRTGGLAPKQIAYDFKCSSTLVYRIAAQFQIPISSVRAA